MVMRGRMARVLISRPVQARNQCVLAKTVAAPRPRDMRKIVNAFIDISKGGGFTHMVRE